MPSIFSFDTILYHPLQRRERRHSIASPGACTGNRRSDLDAVPTAVDRRKPSHRAINTALRSRSSSPAPIIVAAINSLRNRWLAGLALDIDPKLPATTAMDCRYHRPTGGPHPSQLARSTFSLLAATPNTPPSITGAVDKLAGRLHPASAAAGLSTESMIVYDMWGHDLNVNVEKSKGLLGVH
uniref:Uncharacterized protein n=1 Tax=Oryza punctata TaxID=4537 RepID=A0A0E0L0G9_ORYPU